MGSPLIMCVTLWWTCSNMSAPSLSSDPGAAVQKGSHQHRAEVQNALLHPAAHTSLSAMQDTVAFLSSKHTWPGHVQFFIHQHPQVLLSRVALTVLLSRLLILRVAPTQVQYLALGLVDHDEIPMGPFLELLQIPLDGIPLYQLHQPAWCQGQTC